MLVQTRGLDLSCQPRCSAAFQQQSYLEARHAARDGGGQLGGAEAHSVDVVGTPRQCLPGRGHQVRGGFQAVLHIEGNTSHGTP